MLSFHFDFSQKHVFFFYIISSLYFLCANFIPTFFPNFNLYVFFLIHNSLLVKTVCLLFKSWIRSAAHFTKINIIIFREWSVKDMNISGHTGIFKKIIICLDFSCLIFNMNINSFLFYNSEIWRVSILKEEDVPVLAAKTDCLPFYIIKGVAIACFIYARCLASGFSLKANKDLAKEFYSKVTVSFVKYNFSYIQ